MLGKAHQQLHAGLAFQQRPCPAVPRLAVRAVAQPQTATEPLTKDDLVAYLASGCKPRDQWR